MPQQFRSPSPNTGNPQWQQPSQPPQSQPPQSYPPPQIILPVTPRPALPPSRKLSGAGRKGAIRLLLIGMALCVVVALASLFAFTRDGSPQSATTPQAHATQPVGQSTRSAAPTQGATSQPSQPTSNPATQTTTGINPGVNSPILGGNLSAFTAKYGQPNNHSVPASGLYHFKRYAGSSLDFLIINTDLADGSAYASRVESLTIQALTPWSQQDATTVCAAFLPPDAVYKQQINLIYGYDNIYFSASLAQLFPASAFVDVNGKQVQAGLFDVEYLYQHGTKNIVSCSFMVGTQQTQI